MLGMASQILVDALSSAHGSALLLSVSGYLVYSGVRAVRTHPSASPGGSKVCEGRRGAVARLSAAVMVLAVFFCIMTNTTSVPDDAICADVESTDEVRQISPSQQPDNTVSTTIPLAMPNPHGGGAMSKSLRFANALKEARPSVNDALPVKSVPVVSVQTGLEACKQQVGLLMHLKCHGKLVRTDSISAADAADVLSSSRKLMGALHTQKAGDADEWASASVEWARITYAALTSQCSASSEDLKALRRVKTAPTKTVILSLRRFQKLESFLKDALISARKSTALLAPQATAGSSTAGDELTDLRDAQVSASTCMLEAVQEAWQLALTLPRSNAHVRTALRCSGDMLAGLETLVVSSSMELKDSGAAFALGTYLSQRAIAEHSSVPFFGTHDASTQWVAGGGGVHVPEDMATAEELLQHDEELTQGSLKGDRAAARALRLYQHAKHLALRHHDAAAEWRYREASQVAAAHRRPKLAAHSLTRLGFLLSLRGRKDEAQDAVNDALLHFDDPLAQYLSVSLRRSAGQLETDAEVRSAQDVLVAVAGQLPSKVLEEQRAQEHNEIAWWGRVADGGMQVCLSAQDAAQFLICLFCGVAFNLPISISA